MNWIRCSSSAIDHIYKDPTDAYVFPPPHHTAPAEISTTMPREEPTTPPSGTSALPKSTPISKNQSGHLPHQSGLRPDYRLERKAHVTDMAGRVLVVHASDFMNDYLSHWNADGGFDDPFNFAEGMNKKNGQDFVSVNTSVMFARCFVDQTYT